VLVQVQSAATSITYILKIDQALAFQGFFHAQRELSGAIKLWSRPDGITVILEKLTSLYPA
jgi:hypothetical protein